MLGGAGCAAERMAGPLAMPTLSAACPLQEVRADFLLQWTTAVTVISIAFFNFFGVRWVGLEREGGCIHRVRCVCTW